MQRKLSRPEPDNHGRSLSEDVVENTRAATNRFSLNEDMDDGDAFLPHVAPPPSYQPSPLRNNEVHPRSTKYNADAPDEQARVNRPRLFKRASSHRRSQSETRMADLYREAEETKKAYNSDDEGDGRPTIPRRVSSDEMIKHQSGTFSSLGQEAGASQESLVNGTQFNRTFDRHPSKGWATHDRISGSSSDRSEVSADPLHDTSRVDGQSSPASSIESLPPPKLYNSPHRSRRLRDDLMYNAGHVPPSESTFNSPSLREQPLPSVLLPGNGQPIPVRREPSPSPTLCTRPSFGSLECVPSGITEGR